MNKRQTMDFNLPFQIHHFSHIPSYRRNTKYSRFSFLFSHYYFFFLQNILKIPKYNIKKYKKKTYIIHCL